MSFDSKALASRHSACDRALYLYVFLLALFLYLFWSVNLGALVHFFSLIFDYIFAIHTKIRCAIITWRRVDGTKLAVEIWREGICVKLGFFERAALDVQRVGLTTIITSLSASQTVKVTEAFVGIFAK